MKFVEGIISGLNGTDAYSAAYPESSRDAARSSAATLLANPSIQDEIARLRKLAEEKAGGPVLSLAEKRMRIARIVRAKPSEASADNEDCQIQVTKMGPVYVFPDKLAAIKLDNDLSGQGSEATANDALGALLTRIMTKK